MAYEFLKRFLKTHPLMGIEAEMPLLGNCAGTRNPVWIKEGPLYEIFVRQFSKAGTLRAVQEKLPYLKNLGIKTIWLMPIHPIGQKDRKGQAGSPYAIADYMEIDPALGTKDDFRSLITTVHQLDMRLILDLVINHTANDHPWHQQHPEFYLYPHKNDKVRKVAEWSDITDLNYDHKVLRTKVAEVVHYWVETFDIDGYRCDVAGLVPADFWKAVVNDLYKVKPDLFMLAEWQSSRMHATAFHAYYDWVLYWLMRDIRKNKRKAADILTWLNLRQKLFPAQSTALQFTENHDYPRTARIFGNQAFQPFAALTFLLPGLPLLYAGQEYGMLEMPSLFEKQPLDWQQVNEQVFNFYKKIIDLYRHQPPLREGNVALLDTDNKYSLILKIGKRNKYLYALLNFSSQKQTLHCAELKDMVGTDLLSGQLFDGSDIHLTAYQVLISDLVEDDSLMI
jgi:glycosidase